ncbi:small multi-drug export protein, partial [Methanocalculus sp.]|uniref:small multi-drug export protein n=1 Tax=Methanocalculus sp. TaxID=2004547 RepID=UPI0017ED65C4
MDIPDEYPLIGVVVPFLLILIYVAISSIFLPSLLLLTLLSLVLAYLATPIGRWIIPVAIVAGFPWWYAGLTVLILDAVGALFMAWNFQHLFTLPRIGPYMHGLVLDVEAMIAEKPWMERLTAFTLLLYVTLPIQGAGSLMGSAIGRLIGIDPWKVFWIMVVGSAIGSFGMAFGSDALRIFLIGNIATGVTVLLIMLFSALFT